MVAAHKPYPMPDDPLYLPVQAGAKGKDSIGFARDDQGDSISSANPYLSELTALYWAWKIWTNRAMPLDWPIIAATSKATRPSRL
ncbi:DUF4422 domain-containing protein [Allobaculum sp. Allo2]|uniref:DUF4422 domain-containing protein n=1 Tax=Allobaculum sp. Allo2 TaxID=2853432 RepID=UPI002112B240|nr:DUF4422 domain-containing protein [Allobaculum sp. Allo2]UNT93535.1 DUF4422 domain-containing protein [Allobaculum sp. Allo2]